MDMLRLHHLPVVNCTAALARVAVTELPACLPTPAESAARLLQPLPAAAYTQNSAHNLQQLRRSAAHAGQAEGASTWHSNC